MKSGEEIRERMRQRKRKAIIRKRLIKTGVWLFLFLIVLLYCTWKKNRTNYTVQPSEQVQIENEENNDYSTRRNGGCSFEYGRRQKEEGNKKVCRSGDSKAS